MVGTRFYGNLGFASEANDFFGVLTAGTNPGDGGVPDNLADPIQARWG